MRRICPLLIVVIVLSMGILTACGSVAPSEELQELEENLRDDQAQQIREIPNAARYLEQARQYRRVSEEAREERRESRSREYAILGLLRYETAVAIYDQFSMAEELNAVNEEIQEVNPRVREVTSSRNELAEELRELDEEIREAVRDREERRLASLQEDQQGVEAAGGDAGAQDAEVLEEANEQISKAEELRDKALEYDAGEYSETRGLFQRAETQLENAQNIIRENPGAAQTAIRQISFSVQLFEEAYEQAVPVHEEFVEMMRPENRIASIRDEAVANFGAQYTEDETEGTTVIMAGLFVQGEREFQRETDAWLNALADLVNEYEEFSVRIDGHTRRGGGTTENLALSQSRAQKVQNILVDAGVDSSRIRHDGHGQQDIRFDDNADHNDRVEVTLTHSGQ